MKNCEEMVNSLLVRRQQYIARQRRKKKIILGVASTACCCVLAVLLGLGLRQGRVPHAVPPIKAETPSPPTETTPAPEKQDYTVIWAETADGVGDSALADWNGKIIELPLAEALENAPENSKLAIVACPCYDMQLVYNGKTIEQYLWESIAEQKFPEKLMGLLKVGESLKYGEALYTTGTPDGEKWAKSLYDQTVAEFGEELLSKYIVDGVFLKEKVEADIEIAREETTAQVAYESARSACIDKVLDEAQTQLNAQNIAYDRKNDSEYLIFYASGDEFTELSLDPIGIWCFGFASKDQDAPQDYSSVSALDDAGIS